MGLAIIYIAYVVVGLISGVLGGLLGIGGGVITVPCLLFIFKYLGYPQTYLMQMAIATSLAAMIFNTLAATIAHNKRKGVDWNVFKKLIPGLTIGSLIGALIAVWLSTVILEILFGFFLILLAVNTYRQKTTKVKSYKLPSPLLLNALSCSIGALSNLLGIGGGSMTVPMLTAFKMKDRIAIGTSAASTLITTIYGTISYLVFGLGDIPVKDTVGLINVPACLIIGVAAFLIAPYGAKLTHEIDPRKVRKVFALVLVLTGLSLII